MLTKNGEKVYKLKYAKTGKWEVDALKVAKYVADAETTDELKDKYTKIFYELIYNLVFLPGGRTLANSATGIKNLLNCFVLPVDDSRKSIYKTLQDSAEIFAHGGGIGFNFSDVREEGAEITTTNGQASGPLSFLQLFDTTGEVISQASRRGAQIAALDVDHPDIEKFIHYKSTPNHRNKRLLEEYKRNLRNNKLNDKGEKYFHVLEKTLQDDQLAHFNVSVSIKDEFMVAVNENKEWSLISRKTGKPVYTLKARDLIHQIAETAWESGDPGVLFYNRTNEDNMVKYINDIKCTNPCVTGDTLILTVNYGPKTFKELADKGENVLVYTWNPVKKLPEVSVMMEPRMTRESAELIEITFDSGLKLKCTLDHSLYTFRGEKILAKDLKVGQAVRAYSVSLHSDGHLRAHGYADGKVQHQYTARMVWEYFHETPVGDFIIHHKDFNKLNNDIENLELLSNSEHNSVHYPYRIDSGFNHKVTEIKYLEEKESVYNGTVDNTHTYIICDSSPVAGVYSGIVSANCGEIGLLPYEACCLGSINLTKFVEENEDGNLVINFPFMEYAVRNSIRFLDNVQEITELPIEEVNYYSKGLRRLGLGVFGWADMLAMLEIPYNSKDAIELANYLSWFISFFSWLESIELAKEKGPFKLYDKEQVDLSVVQRVLHSKHNPHKFNMDEIRNNGLRNVSVTSIAPTGTISLLAGCNSGIEPFFALFYKRNITEGIGNTAKDYMIEVNPILLDKLKKYKVDWDEINKLIAWLSEGNSFRNFESEKIPEKLKRVFISSHEITPFEHVDMQASWQKYITNSISKTINLPENATVQDIEDVLIYAWNQDVKGLTVYRDRSKSFQVLNVGK